MTKKKISFPFPLIQFFESYKEHREFREWAFGDGDFDLRDAPRIWNNLHGDKFKLDGSDQIVDSLTRMIEIWKSNINEC